MEIKLLFLMFLSLCAFLNGHQELSSGHDLGFTDQGHEPHAMPRKLMLNQKVESVADNELMSYNDDLSGETHNKVGREEEARTTTTSSELSMHEGSYPTHMFTMDYSPVRRRQPVHNKSLPTTTTSP